jgi:hypothetical protein
MDILASLAAASGLSQEAVLHIAQGVATAIESDKSAECFIASSEADQTKIACAYLEHYCRQGKEMAIKYHMNPAPLNAYVYARLSA